MRKEDKAIFEALTDEQLMGLCIEREAGGEPLDGKIAVGTVILERVDHRNWDGKTIKEVILKAWQFSWTMPEAGISYYEEARRIAQSWDYEYMRRPALQVSLGVAVSMLKGDIPRDTDLAAEHCCQYLNPITAAANRAKWLALGMTIIKKIGHHEFFREV